MADRIYVTYTSTTAPGTYHATIHYERTGPAGEVVQHVTIEAEPENLEKLSASDKAIGVVEEVFRKNDGPSRFGRIDAPNVTPRDPEQLETTPESAPLLGIFSDEPMLPLPHAVWGLPDRSSASRNGALSDFLAGLIRRNPAELPPDDDPRGFDRDGRAKAWFL